MTGCIFCIIHAQLRTRLPALVLGKTRAFVRFCLYVFKLPASVLTFNDLRINIEATCAGREIIKLATSDETGIFQRGKKVVAIIMSSRSTFSMLRMERGFEIDTFDN